ncbi:MAG: hypothetical protein V3U29_01275 [Phycisphaeraceae bacterium]
MDQQSNQARALLEVWEVLWRFRWRFILAAFIVTSAVLAASMLLPRKYRAEAIFERSNDMVLTEITQRGAPRSFQDPRQLLIKEVAGSPAIEQLKQTLDPILRQRYRTNPLAGFHDFYASLSRRVVVQYEFASNERDRIRVEYVGNDPVLSRLVVNTLVEHYIQRTRAQMEARLRASAKFFQDEVNNARHQIEQVESKKLTFEIEHLELLPDNPNSVQMVLMEKQILLAEARQQHDNAVLQVQALEQELTKTPKTSPQVFTGRNPELQRLESKLREAQSELSRYTGIYKMTERHPDVIALRQQIETISDEIANTQVEVVTQTRIGQNPKRTELELRLTVARVQAESLDKQYTSLSAELDRLNAQSTELFPVRSEYSKISRTAEQAQRQLSFWEDNLRRVNMALAAESSNRGVRLEFIKPCGVIRKPVSPNLVQVLMAAAALGLMAGSISVFFAHRTDETIADDEHLAEAFDLPLIGSVSEIISQQQRRARQIRNLVVYPLNTAVMALVLLAMATLLYLNLEKPTMYEQLKQDPAASPRQQAADDSAQTVQNQD